MPKIKDGIDLKELEKYGYKDVEVYYLKSVTRNRDIIIWKYNRGIVDYLKDSTTWHS